jgi:ElaB/YqjD/DUF883 family membrane-anchored ribosome-binding protein
MSIDNAGSTKKFEEALQLLNEAAKEKKDEIQNLLGDKYSDIRKVIEQAAGKQKQNLKRVQRVAEDWMEEGEEKLRDVVTEVDERVHENPWPYIGGVAVGALMLGFILGSSSGNK